MTEVQRYEPGTTNSLEAWADQAKAAGNIARAMAPTPWVPSSLRVPNDLERTTANVAAAVLTGFELGLKPMAALRSIDVINGTPALRAVALRALVQQAGHEIWLVESTKTQAVMRGKRAGEGNAQESKWTIERARDLGLTTRDQWKKQPAAMLVARATAELCRLIASDVILGLPYVAEELDDPEGTPETPAPVARRRTAQRRPVAVAREQGADETPAPAAVEPTQPDDPFDDEDGADPVDSPLSGLFHAVGIEHTQVVINEPPTATTAPPLITSPPPKDSPVPLPINTAQRKLIMLQCNNLGIKDRDDRLAIYSRVTGRQVDSTNNLTLAEANDVITELDAMQEASNAHGDDDVDDGLFGDDPA